MKQLFLRNEKQNPLKSKMCTNQIVWIQLCLQQQFLYQLIQPTSYNKLPISFCIIFNQLVDHMKGNPLNKISYATAVFFLLIVSSNSWCFDTKITQFSSSTQIDFSPDNIHFLSVDNANSVVNFWRRDTKQLVYVYTTPSAPISAKFSKIGTYIGIGMQSGNILILNGMSMTTYGTIPTPVGGAIVEIDFSWNSNSLVACSNNQVHFLSIDGNSTWSITGKSSIISCKLNKADGIGFSFSTDQLAWYKFNTSTRLGYEKTGTFRQVDFSMDPNDTGPRLLGANTDKNVYEVKNGDNRPVNKILVDIIDVYTVCYSRDNNYYAAGNKDGYLYIVNATNWNNTAFAMFTDTTASIMHCRFSHDSQYLAASILGSGSIFFYTSNCFPNKCAQGSYADSSGVCRSCSSIVGCLMCSSSTVCNYCIQGFYLNGLICSSCSSNGCRSCESSAKCTQCQQGYFLNYSSNTCAQCQNSIVGCISCERNSTNSTVFCRQCNSEFYLNATDSLCYACVSGNLKCLRCNSSSSCLQCQMGFYLDSSFACQTCTSNCLICTNITACIVCFKGYYVNSANSCVACGPNCLDCYNTGACFSCNKGTFLNAGACSSCASPCSSCNSSSSFCLSCGLGYYYAALGSCLTCNTNCLTCNDTSYCTSCEIGYYVNSSNLCSICYTAFSNCSTCNTLTCFSCQSGFFLNSSNSCQSCSSLSNCYVCTSSTVCSQCNIGFYLSAGNCLSCPTQCESCTNSTSCVNCIVGYYINSTNSCAACTSPCISCTTAANCLSCQNGFFLDTTASPNACTKCLLSIVGCVSCNSSSFCNQCELGRYVSSSGSCTICPSNCSTCNASSFCLSCNVGYYINAGICVKCQQNCSQCSSSTVCSSCNVGFYLNTSLSANNCLPCYSVGCETCNVNRCLSCQIGFYLSSSSCLACNSTYANCLTCSESVCVRCMYGFYANSGVCTLCYNTLNGCIGCYNNTVCSECGVGYYLASNSTCAFCPLQCKTCKNNICTSCQSLYTFNAAQTDCLLCESFIKGCQICSANNSCLSCYEGYYLSSNSCSYCKASLLGCISCFNSSFCSVCQDAYYLVNGVCMGCESIQSCLYCTNSTACLSCMSGYYLNTNKTCSMCTVSLPNCVFCSSPSTCKQCQTGYFLNSTSGQCQLCANTLGGCLSCLNQSKCINCDGGYYLSTTTFACVSCNVSGCQVCGDSSPNVCLSCSLGYYLSATLCISCPQSGCLECSNSSACLKCETGYYLSAFSCVKCQSTLTACSKCLNSSVCTQCDTTFFLNSSLQCSQCSTNLAFCQICFNSSYCSTCTNAYYSQSGVCLSCSSISGCFMCLSSSVCQNCFKGYFLSANQCIQCSNILPNCFDCSNSSVCIGCQSGYILDASNNCNAVSVSGGVEAEPIPYLQVKTYYVSSQTLKHVFSTKQGYTFTQQTLGWNSATTISLYNSATSTNIVLTITSVEWGKGSSSIIFYTNNPLNINSDTFSMSFARLLVTQNDFSLSYQTKFKMSQAALALLLPNQIIPNDFTQDQPLMEPSFYMSYIKNSGEYYFSIIGYVIAAALFLNFFIKATCTASNSKNMGSIIPHIFSLKTCALMVYPIYPQIANFCFGLMAADLPWFTQYYASYLTLTSDVQPAGFQLFFQNMNFASLYLSAFVLFLLLLLLGYLSFSKTQKGQDEIFSLEQETNNRTNNTNEASYAYLKMLYFYFGFGITFAGAASIQGSLYNPVTDFSINGLFYMIGGVVYCAQLAVTVKLTIKERRSCYLRSFIKASILSVAHISPVYICTVAFVADEIIVCAQFYKQKQTLLFPMWWLVKNTLANLSLLFLYYFNEKIIAVFSVIAALFFIILIEFIEHINETGEQTISKRINPAASGEFKLNSICISDQNQDAINYLTDFKINDKQEELPRSTIFNQSKTTFKSSNGFSDEMNNTKLFKNSQRTSKRYRPFRKEPTSMNLIIEKEQLNFQEQ